jgi:hypothetical protein
LPKTRPPARPRKRRMRSGFCWWSRGGDRLKLRNSCRIRYLLPLATTLV